MKSFRNIPKSPSPRCRSPLKAGKKSLHGFAKTSWDSAISRRSGRSSSLESSTVWNIGSPVETATTSTRLLPRKPPRRNRASASRLQSGTGSSCKQRKTGSSHWGTPCCTYRYRLWLLAGCVRVDAPCFCFIVVGCTSNRITVTPYRFLPAPARTTR